MIFDASTAGQALPVAAVAVVLILAGIALLTRRANRRQSARIIATVRTGSLVGTDRDPFCECRKGFVPPF